jgi:hypothetical protein
VSSSVNDSGPTRLTLLRFLERARLRDLERTRWWITKEEQREAEHRRGIVERPAPPDRLLKQGLNAGQPARHVHAGDCCNTGKRSESIDQEQARRALAGGVKAYPRCRPDSALLVLD